MNSKHTPGPWKAAVGGVYIDADDGRLVATVQTEQYDDRIANARLIAAAPELLEALKEMSDLLALDEKECVNCYAMRGRHSVREAIAKATGTPKA